MPSQTDVHAADTAGDVERSIRDGHALTTCLMLVCERNLVYGKSAHRALQRTGEGGALQSGDAGFRRRETSCRVGGAGGTNGRCVPAAEGALLPLELAWWRALDEKVSLHRNEVRAADARTIMVTAGFAQATRARNLPIPRRAGRRAHLCTARQALRPT